MNFASISWQEEMWVLVQLIVAVLLGCIIGYEREQAAKPAGVRTHGMVSLGASLFTVISLYGFGGIGEPARVAAQIVSGIVFLGAGLILRQRGSVQGLTTAASPWVTAASGVGMMVMALATTLLVYLLLHFGPHARPKA